MTPLEAVQLYQEAEAERTRAEREYLDAKRRLELANVKTSRALSYIRGLQLPPNRRKTVKGGP